MTAAAKRKYSLQDSVEARVQSIDWARVCRRSRRIGFALFEQLLTAEECAELAASMETTAISAARS